MKSPIVTFVFGVALAVAIMAGIYSQIGPRTDPSSANQAQSQLDKTTAAQDQQALLLKSIEDKFGALNENIQQFGSKVDGLVDRVDDLEKSQTGSDLSTQSATLPANPAANDDLPETGQAHSSIQNPPVPKIPFEQRLNDNFVAEQIDPNWSITSQDNVQALFLNQDNPVYRTSHLKSIECRSTSCKVEVAHNPDIDSEDFESEFLIDAARAGFARVRGHYDDQNGVKLGIYYLQPKSDTPTVRSKENKQRN